MPFVIDASVVLDWAFEEGNADADIAMRRIGAEGATAPVIWWYELRNVPLIGERRGRLTAGEISRILRDVARFAITVDASPDEGRLIALARRHRLTVCDGAYLELAAKGDLPLATLDRALADAARAERVALLSDVSE